MYKQKRESNNYNEGQQHVHTEEPKSLAERRKEEQKEWDEQNKGVYKREGIQRNRKPEHRTGYLLPGAKIMEPKPNTQIPTLNILTTIHMFGYVWFPDYPEMQQTTTQVDRRKIGLELLNMTYKQIWTRRTSKDGKRIDRRNDRRNTGGTRTRQGVGLSTER